MGKLLRVLVVILLLLSIAAFSLGYLLFQKRETLKGHVQDLASQVVTVAGFIEAEQSPDLTKSENPRMDKEVSLAQLLTYKLDPTVTLVETNKPATMEQTMGLLRGKAQAQLSILNDTRAALAQKIQELDIATNKIIALEGNVVKVEGEKKELQDKITGLEKDIAEKKAKIEEVTASLEEVTAKVADLNENIAKLKDTILDKDDTIKTLKDTIARLTPKAGGTNAPPGTLTQGTKGNLVLVNKAWNFVVIGMTNTAGIGVGTELTIQRGDKLIGKVKISDLNEQYQLAIADLLMAPWKQADAEVGDNVFY